MGKLTGQTVASSYDQLLIVNDADGISASLQAIESADTGGSSSALKIATSKVEVIPASDGTSIFEVSKNNGTPVLSIDTGNSRVGIGLDNPTELLHLKSSTSAKPVLRIENANADALPPYIHLVKTSASQADDDFLGVIGFKGLNHTDEEIEYAFISAQSTDVTDGTEDGIINFGTMKNASGSGSAASINMVLNGANVGIGTTSPSFLLDIEKSVDGDFEAIQISNTNSANDTGDSVSIRMTPDNAQLNSARILVGKDEDYSTSANNSAFMAFWLTKDNSHAEKVRISSDGKVGIGVTDPDSILEIDVDNTYIHGTDSGDGGNSRFRLGDDTGNGGYLQLYADNETVATTIRSYTISSCQAFFNGLDSSGDTGRVGIGITAPSTLLHLKSEVPTLRIEDTTNGVIGQIGNANNFISSATAGEFGIGAVGALVLATGGTTSTERMIITSSGDVGIGATSPTTKLQVNGGIAGGLVDLSAAGPTDNLDVSGAYFVNCNTGSNSVTIGGLTGGVDGQVIFIAKTATANSLILEHNEGANQSIYLTSGSDESIVGYGGWTLVCNGTHWFSVSNPAGLVDAG